MFVGQTKSKNPKGNVAVGNVCESNISSNSDYLLSGTLLSALKQRWTFITSALCLFVGEVIPSSEMEGGESSIKSDFMAKRVTEIRWGDFRAAPKKGHRWKLSLSGMRLPENIKQPRWEATEDMATRGLGSPRCDAAAQPHNFLSVILCIQTRDVRRRRWTGIMKLWGTRTDLCPLLFCWHFNQFSFQRLNHVDQEKKKRGEVGKKQYLYGSGLTRSTSSRSGRIHVQSRMLCNMTLSDLWTLTCFLRKHSDLHSCNFDNKNFKEREGW